MAVVREVDAVKGDRDVELHGRRPERIVVAIVKRSAFHQVIRQDQRYRAEIFDSAARLADREIDLV